MELRTGGNHVDERVSAQSVCPAGGKVESEGHGGSEHATGGVKRR